MIVNSADKCFSIIFVFKKCNGIRLEQFFSVVLSCMISSGYSFPNGGSMRV